MIILKGCHLTSSNIGELNEFARRLSISKAWYSSDPQPHYEVICAHTQDRIEKILDRKNKRHEKESKSNR